MRTLLPVLCLVGCAAPSADRARAAWLIERLTEDNTVWLNRSSDLVADKYAKMAADPYDFMRGTVALYLEDASRPDVDRAPTAFLRLPSASAVRVVGDPHPENLGTCLPGLEPPLGEGDPVATLSLEWVDLDASAFGPWTLDTRRAALAIALSTEGPGCDGPCLEGTLAAFTGAYVDELRTGSWDPEADAPVDGAWALELRGDAREDGVSGEALEDLTTVIDGVRRIAVVPEVDAAGDGVLAPTADEAAQARRLLASWDAVPGARVLDIARWYGRGVASLPATRFIVLWDTGDDGLDDDRLLNLREVVDPPRQPVPPGGEPALLPPGAERIESGTALWSRRDADVLYRGLVDGEQVFKATAASGWFRTFDHGDLQGDLATGDADADDAAAFGALVGRALAAAHARGTTSAGEAAGPSILADLDLGGGEATLVDERLRDGAADLDRLRADHALFVDALDQLGPWLGADALEDR